ncbi:hypothetical protein QN277_026973 [Acacia crassicarpa]|uniref:Uncharacterized protein n=1 Tax=Acacia crassicarpa TaxID=499986 RepID=A0AAE1J8Y4_9FABA|nr:hypothetical protein QN277_026973 [Acacia crassicarpa]
MSAPTVYPPPPPPRKVAKDGIPLPPDRTICPLCLQKRGNPSGITVCLLLYLHLQVHYSGMMTGLKI